MAVLVEAISVIVRRNAIDKSFTGGWNEFVNFIPNNTLCYDDNLARVGFMRPSQVKKFVKRLEKNGLIFVKQGKAVDISVVDQIRGFTMQTDWLEFAHLRIGGTDNKVAVCWLVREPKIASYGLHMPGERMTLATPDGWSYEESLSANFKFVAIDEIKKKPKFLHHESGIDIYLDPTTDKEVYADRIAQNNKYHSDYSTVTEAKVKEADLQTHQGMENLQDRLGKMNENFPVRNQTNVIKYQQDICKALSISNTWFDQASKVIPNQHFVDWLSGDQRDYADSLGLLNRGFCPICGHEPIDKTYLRQFTFGKSVEYMCINCFRKMNERSEALRASLPTGYKRRYYTLKAIKWLIIMGILIGIFYLIRVGLRLF